MFLLIAGFGLSCLPQILIWILVVVLFLVILFLILQKAPEPIGSWARWIVLIIGLILLLILLIQIAQGGLHWIC